MEVLKKEEFQMLAYLAASAGIKMAISGWTKTSKKKKLVGKVSDLVIFPLKSCGGIHVEEAECTYAGLQTSGSDIIVKDRHWMITSRDYEPITLMDYPKAAKIHVEVAKDGLLLSAPSLEKIKVPFVLPGAPEVTTIVSADEVKGLDCGEEIACWLQKHFGMSGLRLVHSSPQQAKVVRSKYKQKMGNNDAVAFAWSTPVTVLCEASLTDLNKRLDKPITSETMRMNIIVDGGEAYEEETWSEAIVGDVHFTFVKLCDRCRTVEVDIDSGERYKKNGPLTTLRKYRPLPKEYGYRPIFGTKYKIVKPGLIRIGDPVYMLC